VTRRGVTALALVASLGSRVSADVRRTEERLDPRERAHAAMARMRDLLQDAWWCEIGEGGRELRFAGPRGKGRLRHDDRRLTLDGAPVLDPASVRFVALGAGWLRIRVAVPRPRGAALKLFEEIYMPAIGDRTSAWRPVLEPPR
jgi:hypothetical protein